MSFVRSQLDLERRHAIGTHDHMLRQINRDHVTRLHVQDVAQQYLTTGNYRAQGHGDIQHVLFQGIDPTFVLIVQVRLEAGVEHFTHGFDHRIRHGHVHVAATAIEFDMKGRDYDRFARTDDVGHGRVYFGVYVLEAHVHDRLPGFFQVDKRLFKYHPHDTQLGGRELPPFDLGVSAVTAKKVVH